MNIFGMDELRSLIETNEEFSVSIFFPTYRAGAKVQQNRIRFKQLIQKTKLFLTGKGWKSVQADEFLSPLKSLFRDEMFWQHPTEGLALFLNAEFFVYHRLPFDCQEQVMVDRRFLIRPLLPLLTNNHEFYVLAISENGQRFLKGSMFDVEELSVKTLPQNLAEAIRFNVPPERQLQPHTQTPRIPGSRAATIFYGHGVGIDDEKRDLQEYCRQVDRGLHPLLKNETAPLVLATVDALFYMYGKMNTYPHLMEDFIPGNPELLSNIELRNRAWSIVASHFAKETKKLLKTHVDLAGTDLVTNNVEEILSAARQGRVQYIVVNGDQPWWGQYIEDTGRVESHETAQPADTEIVNLALIESLRTGAQAYELKPPSTDYPSMLAIYRY